MSEENETNASEEEKKGEADSPDDDKNGGDEKTDKEAAEEGEEGKANEVIIDPKDWPLVGIKEHSDNDVLFGRGGKICFDME